MSRTAVGCLISFLVVALVVSVGVNVLQSVALLGEGIAEMPQQRQRLSEQVVVPAKADSADKIVQIDLEGIITSMDMGGMFGPGMPALDTIKRALEQAVQDKAVKAIVLQINSPGGEVTASDTLYAAVKKAAAKKPVIVHMGSMAASGGYYVACGATKVVASETTLTGSIGVIMESMSYHELFGKVGLGTQTFTSGAFKDTLSGARPMREDERQYVQALVDQMYDRFLGIVAEARKLPKEQLKSTVADGRIVLGRAALEAKLVDQVGYIEDAYTLARELGKAPNAAVLKYRSTPGFLTALGLAATRAAEPPAKIEVDVAGALRPQLQPGVLYYLPPTFAR